MRDGNHRLGSFKNADLASLIFRSGNTVYLTLVKIQYHYSIACPWKHGWFRSISVVMVNVINIITISWQPLYANLAPLSIWYFSKRRHSNARPRKHGYRHQNYISKYTRNEDMLNWSKWHICSKKTSKMTFSKKWKKIVYSILDWSLDLKYFIPMCTRNKVILNWSKWHIYLKKTVEND